MYGYPERSKGGCFYSSGVVLTRTGENDRLQFQPLGCL